MRWLSVMCAALVANGVACVSESEPLASEQRARPKQKPSAGPLDEEPPLEAWTAKILSATPDGSLCPEESVAANIADDGHTATITFSAAEVLGEDEVRMPSGSCRISVELEVPDGTQFRNATAFPSGYIFANEGKSDMSFGYSYPESGARQVIDHFDLVGDESFVFDDRFDITWSPTCGADAAKPLRLELDFQLSAIGDAYLNVSTIDLNFDIDSSVEWRRCG
ncbi:MAG TPA: DUF4360 domain-containing protein [Polyangiales bacterium]|nr:DUF4360 domain-containing protein [Polyangiales bacterium]